MSKVRNPVTETLIEMAGTDDYLGCERAMIRFAGELRTGFVLNQLLFEVKRARAMGRARDYFWKDDKELAKDIESTLHSKGGCHSHRRSRYF